MNLWYKRNNGRRNPEVLSLKKARLQRENSIAGIMVYAMRFFVATTVLSALVLLSPRGKAAETASKDVSVTVPISCSMSNSASKTYTVSMISGQILTGFGGNTIKALCNDTNGYMIYAIGASGDKYGETDLIHETNSNYNIHTGTDINGAISSWAMKITAGTGTGGEGITVTTPTVNSDFINYHAIPANYTAVAWRDSATDMTTDTAKNGSFIKTYYQIYANPNQPSGNYVGQVRYAMIHPYTENTLKSLGMVLDEAYQNGQVDKVTVGDKPYYTMQSMTSSICEAVNVLGEASQIQLVDIRDNQIYWVTKLNDGHCWMTQNLDFNLVSDTTADGYVALTSENTDLNQFGAKGYTTTDGYSCTNVANPGAAVSSTCTGADEVIGFVPMRNTIAPGELSTSTWAQAYSRPYSYDPGEDDAVDTSMVSAGAGAHALTGNYYNWSAAIAANNSSSFSASTLANTANNPMNSICPKGWRLPTISNNDNAWLPGTTNEFSRLNILYNAGKTSGSGSGTALSKAPIYFSRSGYVNAGAISYAGSRAYYWSSTVRNSTYAYDFYYLSSGVTPASNNYRRMGFTVRCLLR